MKTVFCYGDSNTWGYKPGCGERYSHLVRWPGVLQQQLGGDCRVIEEGLSGRYTVWDDPFRPGRNGAKLLQALLDSHAPLDLVIIMLGTNDVLHFFENTAFDAAQGCSVLVEIVQRSRCGINGKCPNMLLISPPLMGPLSRQLQLQCRGNPAKSQEFAQHYRQVAEFNACQFLDAAKICTASERDGVHLDKNGHHALGLAVSNRITKMLKQTP